MKKGTDARLCYNRSLFGPKAFEVPIKALCYKRSYVIADYVISGVNTRQKTEKMQLPQTSLCYKRSYVITDYVISGVDCTWEIRAIL